MAIKGAETATRMEPRPRARGAPPALPTWVRQRFTIASSMYPVSKEPGPKEEEDLSHERPRHERHPQNTEAVSRSRDGVCEPRAVPTEVAPHGSK
eukprot:scaffold142618_cov145-Phaeocystis_antarctica.AAC.1